MIVHICKPEVSLEYNDWDYDHYATLAVNRIKDYDRFVKFIEFLKKHNQPLALGDQWYTVIEYEFSFPTDFECRPCFKVYVTEYC